MTDLLWPTVPFATLALNGRSGRFADVKTERRDGMDASHA